MDDFTGTFFDLVSPSTSYPISSVSLHSNSNESSSSTSVLDGLSGAPFIGEHMTDLDSMVEASSFPNLSVPSTKQSNGMPSYLDYSSGIHIKSEITDTSTLDFMMEQSNTSLVQQSAEVTSEQSDTVTNGKGEMTSRTSPLTKCPQNSNLVQVTLPTSSSISNNSTSTKLKSLIPVTIHSASGLKRTFIHTTFPTSGPLARLIPISSQSIVSASSLPVIKVEPKEEQKVVPKVSLTDPSHLPMVVSNVVASFRVRCHLNLRRIALESIDVVYKRELQKIVMRLRHPKCTAYIWSSGKIVCTGCSSEENAKRAAKKYTRRLLKMGFTARLSDFKIVNVLVVSKMPYSIDITKFSRAHQGRNCSYEPELHPGATFRDEESKTTLKIFSTGSVTVTGRSVTRAIQGIHNTFPLFKDFYKFDKPKTDLNYDDALPSDSEDFS